MTTMTSSLILSLVDQVTGPARAAARSVAGLRTAAAKNAQQMQAMQGQLLGAVGAAVALAAAVRAPIKAAMEFEAQMASVSTLVDTSTESIADMGREVLEIGKRTPVAIADLTSGLYDVRSAGIAAGEAMSVLEGSARLAVAGLGTTKQATDLVTSSINAFNIPAQEQARLYDVIFKAVKNGKTTIAELSQGFGAVAGTVANAGIEIDEYFASVAALTTAGLPAAQAHTQIRAAIAGLTRETKQSSKIFRALGVKTFAELVEKSGGMVNAFSLIREQVGGNDAEMIKLLGSVEAYNAVLGLSGSVNGKYAETLDDMRNGANAVDEAFQKQSETTRRTIQMFMNSMVQLAVSIGDALLPALRAALDVIGPITSVIAKWAQANPQLISSIAGIVAGLVGFRLVTLSARWAFLFLKGGVLDAALAVARSSQAIVSAGGKIANFTRMVRRLGMSMTLLSATGGTGVMAGFVKGMSGALTAIGPIATSIGAVIAGISAPVWGVIAVVAGLALAVYNYWTPISEFITGFASVVGSALGEAISAIAGAGGRIASAISGWAAEGIVDIGEMLGFNPAVIRSSIDSAAASISAGGTAIIAAVKAIPAALAGWVRDIFTINQYSEQATGEFRSAGERVGQALVDGIKKAFDALWSWLKSLPSKIIAAIGRIDLSGLIKWPSLPRWLGGGTPNPANDNSALAGTREAGGAIVGGRTYLVGEHGPELVTPSRSGYVHDAETTASMRAGGRSAAAGGAGGQTVHLGGVTIQVIAQPGMDPQAIAQAVNEALGQIAGDALSGGQFDQGWSVA
jgi:TP901 family phage tail tape measure protein